MKRLGRMVGIATSIAAIAYAAYVAATWWRYGRVSPAVDPDLSDELLDRFMPSCDIMEQHHIRVSAPAAMTLAAAREMDIARVPLARMVFKAREWIMGASAESREPKGLLADMQDLGWGVLADVPEHEIVMGAVTKPWQPNPVFRAVPRDAFAAFREPDYVKIVWTLRADPIGEQASVFRTETRAAATDDGARAKFRRYWALLSPGIILIRWALLRPLKAEAERRAREVTTRGEAAVPRARSTTASDETAAT